MGFTAGIIFGLLSMLGYGLADAISQSPSKRIGAIRTIFYRGLIIVAVMLTVVLIARDQFSFTLKDAIVLLFISILGYFPLRFFLKGIKRGKVGIVSPVAKSSAIVTVTLSVIFFHEVLSALQLTAIIGIIAGIMLISVNFRDLRRSSLFDPSTGIQYALISSVLWGLVYFLLKLPVAVFGPIIAGFFLEFGTAASAGIHLLLRKSTFPMPDKKTALQLLALALVTVMGTLGFTFGVTQAPVSIVSALSFSAPLVATIYGALVYKEVLRPIQYLGSALIVIGVVTISLL